MGSGREGGGMYLAAVFRVKAPPGMMNKLLTVLSTESPPP